MPDEIKTAFTAVDGDGRHYVVNVWHEHFDQALRAGRENLPADAFSLKTTCGEQLNRLSKGKYQVVETGVILTSDDVNAP